MTSQPKSDHDADIDNFCIDSEIEVEVENEDESYSSKGPDGVEEDLEFVSIYAPSDASFELQSDRLSEFNQSLQDATEQTPMGQETMLIATEIHPQLADDSAEYESVAASSTVMDTVTDTDSSVAQAMCASDSDAPIAVMPVKCPLLVKLTDIIKNAHWEIFVVECREQMFANTQKPELNIFTEALLSSGDATENYNSLVQYCLLNQNLASADSLEHIIMQLGVFLFLAFHEKKSWSQCTKILDVLQFSLNTTYTEWAEVLSIDPAKTLYIAALSYLNSNQTEKSFNLLRDGKWVHATQGVSTEASISRLRLNALIRIMKYYISLVTPQDVQLSSNNPSIPKMTDRYVAMAVTCLDVMLVTYNRDLELNPEAIKKIRLHSHFQTLFLLATQYQLTDHVFTLYHLTCRNKHIKPMLMMPLPQLSVQQIYRLVQQAVRKEPDFCCILYKVAVERKLYIPCEVPPGPCRIYMLMLAEYSVEDMYLTIQLYLQQLVDKCIEDRTSSVLHHGYCEVIVNPIPVADHDCPVEVKTVYHNYGQPKKEFYSNLSCCLSEQFTPSIAYSNFEDCIILHPATVRSHLVQATRREISQGRQTEKSKKDIIKYFTGSSNRDKPLKEVIGEEILEIAVQPLDKFMHQAEENDKHGYPNKTNSNSSLHVPSLLAMDCTLPTALENKLKPHAKHVAMKPHAKHVAMKPHVKPLAVKPHVKPVAVKPHDKPLAVKPLPRPMDEVNNNSHNSGHSRSDSKWMPICSQKQSSLHKVAPYSTKMQASKERHGTNLPKPACDVPQQILTLPTQGTAMNTEYGTLRYAKSTLDITELKNSTQSSIRKAFDKFKDHSKIEYTPSSSSYATGNTVSRSSTDSYSHDYFKIQRSDHVVDRQKVASGRNHPYERYKSTDDQCSDSGTNVQRRMSEPAACSVVNDTRGLHRDNKSLIMLTKNINESFDILPQREKHNTCNSGAINNGRPWQHPVSQAIKKETAEPSNLTGSRKNEYFQPLHMDSSIRDESSQQLPGIHPHQVYKKYSHMESPHQKSVNKRPSLLGTPPAVHGNHLKPHPIAHPKPHLNAHPNPHLNEHPNDHPNHHPNVNSYSNKSQQPPATVKRERSQTHTPTTVMHERSQIHTPTTVMHERSQIHTPTPAQDIQLIILKGKVAHAALNRIDVLKQRGRMNGSAAVSCEDAVSWVMNFASSLGFKNNEMEIQNKLDEYFYKFGGCIVR